jgi:hypothetical protein
VWRDIIRAAERSSTVPDAVSNTTATLDRRVIADWRAIEKSAPRSAIAARTDAPSRIAENRGTASAMSTPMRTTTSKSSTRVNAFRRMLEWNLDDGVAHHHFALDRALQPRFLPTMRSSLMRSSLMRSLRRLLAAAPLLCAAGCANPRAEAATAQALNDAANEIGGLKNDVAQLQTDLDSLRSVVARQDSVISRIVAASPK